MQVRIISMSKDGRRAQVSVGRRGESSTVHVIIVRPGIYEDRHGIRYELSNSLKAVIV